MVTEGLLLGLFGFIVGAVLGSFVKVLADRSLSRKSFLGRSQCPACKQTLKWYDLIPIISYISLSGRCRYCHKKIGAEYLLVEVVMGLLISYLFYVSSVNFQFEILNFKSIFNFQIINAVVELLFKTFFISILAVLTITDLKKTLIPDRITFPAIIIILSYLVIFTIFKISYLYYYLSQNQIGKYLLPSFSDYFRRHALLTADPLFGSIISAILISGFFIALIIVTRGRGMGGGDVKLGFFMGLGLGFPGGILATILGFITGAIVSILLIIAGKKKFGQNIPFGPFLVIGSLVTLFWGSQIMEWYLHLNL